MYLNNFHSLLGGYYSDYSDYDFDERPKGNVFKSIMILLIFLIIIGAIIYSLYQYTNVLDFVKSKFTTLTNAPVTTQPSTNAPVTVQPSTNAPVTAQPSTDAPVASQSSTDAPVANQPLTNAPVATQPLTNAPVATQQLTNAPVATQPLTNVPVATQPLTNAPVATQQLTNAPVATQLLTNAPVTTKQVTNAPVTTKPLTNAPVTTPLKIDAPIFYTDINYGGKGYKLLAGQHNINSMQIPNDTLSSVRIPKGFMVKLFEHSDFKGRTVSLYKDTANFYNLNFNRITSSIIVTKIF